MSARLLPLIALAALWLMTGVACGPSVASLKSRKGEVQSLKRKLRSAKAADKAAKSYGHALKDGSRPFFAVGKAHCVDFNDCGVTISYDNV